MKRAYSYVRFSRAEQAAGDSLRRQTAKAEHYCQRHGLTFDGRNLQDLGVSAFRGANARTGALAGFLKAIETNSVPKGSILIVESLDRITRNQIMEAVELFSSILRRGVGIVTLDPEREYSQELINREPFALMEAILIMVRANEESERKSQRIKAAWVGKRQNANDKKLTANCPYWLELSPDRKRYVVIREAAATVKRIFGLAITGMGAQAIAMQLCRDDVPCFGLKNRWFHTYVLKILRNRAVLGEFQPMQMTAGRNSKREPIGEPILDYFPRIISDADFYRVQQGLDNRKTKKGRNGKGITNLFKGLLFDEKSGSSMIILHSDRRRVIVPSDSRRTKGVKQTSFPYGALEQCFLSFTVGLTSNDVDPTNRPTRDLVADLQAELEGLTQKISDLQEQMESERDIKPLAEVLVRFHKKRTDVAAALEAAKNEKFNETPTGNLTAMQRVLPLLQSAKGERLEQIRTMLRMKIAALVKRIDIAIEVDGHKRTCQASIHLTSGEVKRMVAPCQRGKLKTCFLLHNPQGKRSTGFGLHDVDEGTIASFPLLHY